MKMLDINLDKIYSLASIHNSFFVDGYGSLGTRNYLAERLDVARNNNAREKNKLFPTVTWVSKKVERTYTSYVAEFTSPVVDDKARISYPRECDLGRLMLVLPNLEPNGSDNCRQDMLYRFGYGASKYSNPYTPFCHIEGLLKGDGYCSLVGLLPATGQETFSQRLKTFSVPLADKYGIGTVILEGSYYWSRKPKEQRGSRLRTVTDLLVQGYINTIDAVALVHYFSSIGFRTIGLSGLSMGALHSAIAKNLCTLPIALAAIAAPHSAAPVFADKHYQLFHRVNWQSLHAIPFHLPTTSTTTLLLPVRDTHITNEHRQLGADIADRTDQIQDTSATISSNSIGKEDSTDNYATTQWPNSSVTKTQPLLSILPRFKFSSTSRIRIHNRKQVTDRETNALREYINISDIRCYPKPLVPAASVFLRANRDLFIPRESIDYFCSEDSYGNYSVIHHLEEKKLAEIQKKEASNKAITLTTEMSPSEYHPYLKKIIDDKTDSITQPLALSMDASHVSAFVWNQRICLFAIHESLRRLKRIIH